MHPPDGRPAGSDHAIFVGVVVLLMVGRLVLAPWGTPAMSPDSVEYIQHGNLPLATILNPFTGAPEVFRPMLYPLFLKALGVSTSNDLFSAGVACAAQTALVALSIGWAAVVGARLFPTLRPRLAFAGLFAALSWSELVYPFDTLVLTESLAATLFLLACVHLAAWAARRELRDVAAALAFGVLLAMLRDTLVPVPLTLSVVALLGWRWHAPGRSRRLLLGLAGGTAVIAVLYGASSAMRLHRSELPAIAGSTFIANKLLPDMRGMKALIEIEIPPPQAMTTMNSSWRSIGLWQADKELWAYADRYGRQHHWRLLRSHPDLTWSIWRQSVKAVFAETGRFSPTRNYWVIARPTPRGPETRETLPQVVSRVVLAPMLAAMALGWWVPFVAMIAGTALAAALPRWRAALPLMAFLLATFLSQYTKAVLTAGIEDWRHCLTGTLALAVACWLPLLAVAARRQAESDEEPAR